MKITSRRCLSAAVLVAMGAPAALASSYYGGSNAAPAAYGNPSYNSQAQPQDYASPAQSERQPQGDGPPPLPPGWVEYMDASSGMPYYFHEADGITTWDRPVAEEADASKAPEATFEAREESSPEQGQGETPLSFEPASASNPAAGGTAPQEAEQAIKTTPEGNASLEHERRDMGGQTPPEAMEQPQEPPRQQQQQQSGWGMPEDPRRGPRGDEPPQQQQQQDRPQMPPGDFGGDTPQRPPQQQQQQPPMDPSAGRERPPSDARFGGEGRPPVDNRPPEGRGPDPRQARPETMQQPSWGARPGAMDRAPEKPPAVPPQGPEQPMGQSPPNDANRFSPPPQQQGGPPGARGPPTPGMPPQSSSSDILQRPPEGGYPPPQQQLQQAPLQQQQQAPPQPNQPGGNYPNQPPYQRNPYIAQQYSQGPPPSSPNSYNSYSQYSQYGQYQGYGRQQPPPNQLIPAATSTAVQGALTNAWQGILGFSNRTKEAVETARTSVVTTAKEATETISTKGGGWWGQAKSAVGTLFEPGADTNADYSMTGSYGSAPQSGGAPGHGPPGYPPQGQGYPPSGTGYPPQGQNYPPRSFGYPPQGPGAPPQGTPGQPPAQGGQPRYPPGYGQGPPGQGPPGQGPPGQGPPGQGPPGQGPPGQGLPGQGPPQTRWDPPYPGAQNPNAQQRPQYPPLQSQWDDQQAGQGQYPGGQYPARPGNQGPPPMRPPPRNEGEDGKQTNPWDHPGLNSDY